MYAIQVNQKGYPVFFTRETTRQRTSSITNATKYENEDCAKLKAKSFQFGKVVKVRVAK